MEIPQNINVFLAKDEISPKLECKSAVKVDSDMTQMNALEHFPLYLDCKNYHCEVNFLEKNAFKPIFYSSWLKNVTQQKALKQKPH